jgi:hypothetical protein
VAAGDLETRAGGLMRHLADPVLPDRNKLEEIRVRVLERAGSRSAFLRPGLAWAVAAGALLFGITLGAAAQNWIGLRPTRRAPGTVLTPPAILAPMTRAPRRLLALKAPSTVELPVAPPAPDPLPEEASAPVVRPAPTARKPTRALPDLPATEVAPPAPTDTAVESPRESSFLVAAMKRLRQGHDPRAALAALDEYRQRFPLGNLRDEANLVQVEALVALGERSAALQFLDGQTAKQGPREREMRVLRGELRASSGRCREAVGDFDAALSAHPRDAVDERALFARAACLSRLADTTGALRDLESYHAHFPQGPHASAAEAALRGLR